MEKAFAQSIGPVCVTSGHPGANKVPLGRTLQTLSVGIEGAGDEVSSFCQRHERFADATRLSKISSPHAIKAWAAERLPSLGISYGFSNRSSHDIMEAHFDEQASLRIVQFADDLTLVARFCRTIEHLAIDVSTHPHGLEFRFRFRGRGLGAPFDGLERKGLDDLIAQTVRDNSVRNRIIATEAQIEAQSIALKKRIRLGLSPAF